MPAAVPAVGNTPRPVDPRAGRRSGRARSPGVVRVTAVEGALRGPADIIAALREDPVPGPPAFHEVDSDGRLTYWVDKMG